MKSMKKYYIALLGLSLAIQGSAQAHLSWNPGSTGGNYLYEATEMPDRATPKWTNIFINPETSSYDLTGGKLHLKTAKGSVFGYELKGDSFAPQGAFTFDLKGELLTDTAALDINMNLNEGKSVKLAFQRSSVIDMKSGKTLAENLTSSGLHNYRIAVEGNNAVLYKDADFVSVLNLEGDDVIKDGGFETMTSDEASAYWGHDSWSGVSVVTEKKHSGSKSMKWDSGWTGRFMGVVKVQPNTTYDLSYWAEFVRQTSYGYTQMSGGVYMDGVLVANLPISGSGFNEYKCTFTTGQNTKEISIYYHNGWTASGNHAIYFDDMVLSRKESTPFIQVGNLYTSKDSEINIGKISFFNGTAYRPIGLSDLTSLVGNAETLLSGAEAGADVGDYPSYAIERFETQINKSKGVAENGASTSDDIDNAFIELQNAIEVFNKSQITTPGLVLKTLSTSISQNPLKRNQKGKVQLAGTMSDGSVADLTIADVKYTSLTPSIATVGATGEAFGVAEGNAEIEVAVTLNSEVLKDTLKFSVIEYALSKVDFMTYSSTIEVGEATGTYFKAMMNDNSEALTNDLYVTYASLDADVASVSDAGSIIAKKKGEARIELNVTVFNKTITDTITISVIALESLEIDPAKSKLEKNEESTYTLSARFSDGSTLVLDNTNSVVWTSNRNVLRVDDKGQLKADSVGVAELEVVLNRLPQTLRTKVEVTVVDKLSGISETEGDAVRVYPIPFRDKLIIESDSDIEAVTLFNLSGQKVIESKMSGQKKEELGTENLSEGIYLLHIKKTDKDSSSFKVLKK